MCIDIILKFVVADVHIRVEIVFYQAHLVRASGTNDDHGLHNFRVPKYNIVVYNQRYILLVVTHKDLSTQNGLHRIRPGYVAEY